MKQSGQTKTKKCPKCKESLTEMYEIKYDERGELITGPKTQWGWYCQNCFHVQR